jgi:hypothetical protein
VFATFWQNHDVTDLEDELEEVHEALFDREQAAGGVPLTPAEHETIRRAAAVRGLDKAQLIHEWVKERLGRT